MLLRIALAALCLTLPFRLLYADGGKLVVLISIDQFTHEYLTRFRPHFVDDGFVLLLKRGAVFTNATFEHAVTSTGPGHAVLMSGCYGARNGIVLNTWFDRSTRRSVYCVADDSATMVGATGPGRSPVNMIGMTFGDQLRLHSAFRSRVVSVAGKDRAAVLMGGKLASGAFWMQDSAIVTSTYYGRELPAWARRFNAGGRVNRYFGRTWEPLLPADSYAFLGPDDNLFEDPGPGGERTLPKRITGLNPGAITPSFYDALLASPFGNELVLEFAREAVRGEQLGQREVTDLLCIGLSSNDYVGHAFGPHSWEAMDLVLHADRQLSSFFAFLEEEIGLERCIIAISSDHGVAPIPEYIMQRQPRAGAGRVTAAPIIESCASALSKRFGQPGKGLRWIDDVRGGNIYLSQEALASRKIDASAAAEVVVRELLKRPEIAAAYDAPALRVGMGTKLLRMMHNSYHPARSGDVMFAFVPYLLDSGDHAGTSHGAPYSYDAHVPLLLAGPGIRAGVYHRSVHIVDLAPTLSALTGVELPPMSEGRILDEALGE